MIVQLNNSIYHKFFPYQKKEKDPEIKHLHKEIFHFTPGNPRILITEIIKKTDLRLYLEAANKAYAKELVGLIERSVFRVVVKDDIEDVANMLGSRFILYIKATNADEEKYKVRLIVQGHTDAEK